MSNKASFIDAIEKQKRIRCFMDGIDWQHHLEADANGTKIYPSIRAVKENEKCAASGECGIVEVEVRLIDWIEPQNLFKEKP